MRPGVYALTLYRGDSYSWRFLVWTDNAKTQPADLTGVTAKAEIRDRAGGTTILALACTITTPNTIDMVLTAAQWASWPLLNAGAWDLQLTYPSGAVTTIVGGQVTITADVTDSSVAARALRSAS